MTFKRSLLLLLACGIANIGGCAINAGNDIGEVAVSPDGKMAAFSHEEYVGTAIGGISGIGNKTFNSYLSWCPVDRPQDVRRITVKSALAAATPAGGTAHGLAFSPDSRKLLYLAEIGEVVDLASGEHHAFHPAGEAVSAAAWISEGEIVYWASHNGRLAIYRKKIDKKAAPWDRIEVYSSPTDNAQVYLSPDGRSAVIIPHWGRCLFLDVLTKRTQAFGPDCAEPHGVAWKADGGAALCAVTAIKPTGTAPKGVGVPVVSYFILIDVRAAAVAQIETVQLATAQDHHNLDPLWTADGRYAVDNAGWAACGLIQPKPWKAVSLQKAIVDQLKLGNQTTAPELHRLPVPGWCWTRGGDRKSYAVDYAGKQFVPLADSWLWAMTPDGQRVVEVANGKATVRRIALPAGN